MSLQKEIVLTSGNITKTIGLGSPTFVIAELSGNHHQKYEEAVELIHQAAKAGADAIKLQTYTADTITINSNKEWFVVGGKDQPDAWKQRTLYELYQEAYTPWEWQEKLKLEAEKLGMLLFSTPFDTTAVDFLEKLDVPCYKIASYEVVHLPLIKRIAQTGKPVIMSIGFASEQEIEWALDTLRSNGVKDIVILHCVTAYAEKPDVVAMNLTTINDITKKFDTLAGFSDNNGGIEVPIAAATVYDACAIEKHLILEAGSGGPDARFSITPSEMKRMVDAIRTIEKEGISALSKLLNPKLIEQVKGNPQYGPASPQEQENTIFRPSIWLVKDVKKGEVISEDHVRVCRPQAGMHSYYLPQIIGKKSAMDVEAPYPLTKKIIGDSL